MQGPWKHVSELNSPSCAFQSLYFILYIVYILYFQAWLFTIEIQLSSKGRCALFIHSVIIQMNRWGNCKRSFLFFTAPACQGNLLRPSPQEVQVSPHTERNKKRKRWKSDSDFCQACWPDDTHVTYLFSWWPWWSQMTFRALENKIKPQLFLGKNKWAMSTFLQR